MAGIGFKLQKYFNNDDFIDLIKGTSYSIIISSGPWLISVITIAIVSFFAQKNIDVNSLFTLKAIISYSFASSLLIFGIIEMPLTRYIADQLYKDDYTTFKSVYTLICASVLVICMPLAYLFYSYFPTFSTLTIICSATLLSSIILTWVSMVFLTAAKNYHYIIYSFLGGGILSVTLSILIDKSHGIDGYILAYSCGQYLITVLLSLCIFIEFKTIDYLSFEILAYYRKYKLLVLAGFLYYLGVWIDKIIFWFGPESEKVVGLLYTNKYYDTAMFLAYISIVPSLAIFLVQVETNFYKYYLYYFKSVEEKSDLSVLNLNVLDIFTSIQKTLLNLLKIQLIITVTLWYFSEQILELIYLPSIVAMIFKYGVLGSFLQALFLIVNIMLLYFKNERVVLFHYALFFVLNTLFTFATIELGFKYYGLGYLVSSFIVFFISLRSLNKHLNELNFYTFMSQPIE